MTKYVGIGAKLILPVPKTPFERDLVIAVTDALKEIDDYLKNLESRVEALEP